MKKIVLMLIILAIAVGIIIVCRSGKSNNRNNKVHTITAEEAYHMMQEGNTVIVDVRRQDEYNSGHIRNAILIPDESITDREPEALSDKDSVILVYCRSGNRSRKAAGKLARMGYKNIYDFGGIRSWPYEITEEQ